MPWPLDPDSGLDDANLDPPVRAFVARLREAFNAREDCPEPVRADVCRYLFNAIMLTKYGSGMYQVQSPNAVD